nr:hypothetical protein SYMBAF_100161 [Serratia symbiotica]
MPAILQVAWTLAFFAPHQSLNDVSAWGLMNFIPEMQPATQRKRGSNRFPTNLSLRCHLAVIRII